MWGKKTAIEQYENRLKTVEVLCDRLERAEKKLDLEFIELYDKVNHQMSRMARRAQRAEKENGPTNLPTNADSPSDGLDPVSRSIMLRRARQYGPVEGQ